jgi:outer membrane protein assembly factor BamB
MPGGEARPGQRDALIVATGRYQDPELAALRSPSRDAAELAAVLGDQAIGGFGVQVLLDRAGHVLREEIDGFLADRLPDDLLVLYLSCHGVKDTAGRLHFAASTTKLSRLASTGISASFVYEQVDQCQARRILLLLDCCYSGAYLKGQRPKAENRAGIRQFEGRGRAVITSCTALEYAFEMDTGHVTGTAAAPSVFTSALVEGLRTGQADRDGDGQVSVDDLYAYVFERVRETTPHQTPEKKWGEIRGDFIIARNPRPPAPGPDPAAAADSHSPKPGATRRAALKLGAVSAAAAGLAITGWDLTHHNPPTRRPPRKSTPAHTPLWTFNVPGAGPPGPSLQVGGGIVYTNGDAYTYALRCSDGATLWSSKIPGSLITPPGSTIFYAAGTYDVYALRTDNGRMIWHSPIAFPSWLTITGGVLYATDQYGAVHALRASDGAKLWNFVTSQGESSGLAVAAGVVYTASANQGASVYAIRAGSQVWRSPVGGAEVGPEVAAGTVYVTVIADGASRLCALRSVDGANLWISDFQVPLTPPLVTATRLYIRGIGGIFHALNPHTGAILWSYLPSRRAPGPGPLLTAESVYFASDETLSALSASNGTRIWDYSPGNNIYDFAVTEDAVCIASNDLYLLNAKDGAKLWSYPVQANSVVADDSIFYASSTTGKLYALSA